MSEFSKKLNIIAKDVDLYLKNFFSLHATYSPLIKPMKYGLFSGGKKFRSGIVVSVGKIFSINYKKLIILGSVIECIHSYSLMHDDLPSMDNDSLRRGKPSTHKKFNEFTAILAGNSLLTLAFQILASESFIEKQKVKNKLIQSLSSCCGYTGLAGGQYSDLIFENKKISSKKIIKMQENKTGKLFGFCFESVSIIGNNNYKKNKEFRELGIKIGLLFQIADDLIDLKGNIKTAGKLTGKDADRGKATLLNLWGYEKTLNFALKLKNELKNKIKKYGNKSKDLSECLDFILNRKF